MATVKSKMSRKAAAKKLLKPNEAKFRELVLYIARRSEGDLRFGAIKLNKLLFYADFIAYRELGRPITGQEYFALPNGPAPKYMVPVREKMVRDGEIAIRPKDTFSGVQERTFALREADLSRFTPEEIDLVTRLIQTCWNHSGSYLSELTHKFPGWRLAREKETIPYSVALVGKRPPTHAEITQGLDLEASAAACLSKYAASAV
jgi:hypothetical protein